jgi:hypothetical protein
MNTTYNSLKSLILECREALGFNYTLMIHRHYVSYLESISAKNVSDAAESAAKMAEVIQKQQLYNLHSRFCECVINEILAIEFVPALTDLFRQLALSYDIQARFLEANSIYEKALALLEPYRESDSNKIQWFFATLWYNRAQQKRIGEGVKELTDYTEIALKYYQSVDDHHGISLCYNRLATLLPEDMIEEKLILLKKIVALRIHDDAPSSIALAEINIGYYEIKKGNIDFGVNLMREATKVIEKYTNKRYAALSNLHFAKGLLAANRFYDAKNTCNYAGEILRANAIQAHLHEYESLLEEIEKSIQQLES